jgi:His-Xaa-Ser system protein HxsD
LSAESNHRSEKTLLVDQGVYSREALLRTCYWFTDRCYVFITRPDSGHYAVNLTQKPGAPALETVAGEFTNALLDWQVRLDIQRETADLRELIVAKAFAEGNLLEDSPVGDDRDPVEVVATIGQSSSQKPH